MASGHKDIRAAEIERRASWKHGIEKLQESARTAPREVGVTCIREKSANIQWFPVATGNETSVRRSVFEEYNYLRGDKEDHFSRFCDIHTHPARSSFGIAVGSRLQGPVPIFPPSGLDVENARGNRYHSEFERMRAGKSLSLSWFYGVIDGRGNVWYFRPLMPEEGPHEEARADRREKEIQSEKAQLAQQLLPLLRDGLKNVSPGVRELVEWNLRGLGMLSPSGSKEMAPLILENINILFSNGIEDRFFGPQQLEVARAYGDLLLEEQYRRLPLNDAQKRFAYDSNRSEKLRDGALRGIYAVYAKRGVKLRLVLAEELFSEPPLAGPDYSPRTEKVREENP